MRNHYGLLVLAIFILSGIFYAAAWPQAPLMEPDSQTYMQVAVDLQDGRLDTIHGRSPGYPLLVLLTGASQEPSRALFFTQLMLYFCSIALAAYLLLRFSAPRKWVTVFVVFSLLPYNAVHTGYILTETLTIFMLILGYTCLALWLDKGKWPFLAVAAVSLALSAIVKPTYQALSILAALSLLALYPFIPQLRRRLLTSAGGIFLAALVIIGGMSLYNQQRFGFSGLTPDFGFYLSTKTPRVLERLPDDYKEVREILIKHRDQRLLSVEYSHTGYMYLWGALPEVQKATGLDYPKLSAYMLKLNLTLITAAPLTYIQEVLYSFTNLLLPSTTLLSDFSRRWLQLIWTTAHYLTMAVFFGISVYLTGIGLFFAALSSETRRKLQNRLAETDRLQIVYIVLSLMIIYYTFVISAMTDMGVARHRVPVDLFIFSTILLAFTLWGRIKTWLRSQDL